MDRNSFDSGDWFNRVDWRGIDSTFGSGLPPEPDNGSSWNLMAPLLGNTALKPTPTEIGWTNTAYLDLLRIRSSSTLFRMRTADEVKARLVFANTGPFQVPTVVAAHLDGADYDGAGFKEIVYFVNVDKQPHQLTLAAEQGKAYVLHPVQRAADAADTRARDESHYEAATGRFTIPARTAVVYVVE
jgi:pullulanase/glycogen debranching enzyme